MLGDMSLDMEPFVCPADDGAVLSEAVLCYTENLTIGEGACSCVCISDEQCCGCLLQ